MTAAQRERYEQKLIDARQAEAAAQDAQNPSDKEFALDTAKRRYEEARKIKAGVY